MAALGVVFETVLVAYLPSLRHCSALPTVPEQRGN
jgi:hypothetical protein